MQLPLSTGIVVAGAFKHDHVRIVTAAFQRPAQGERDLFRAAAVHRIDDERYFSAVHAEGHDTDRTFGSQRQRQLTQNSGISPHGMMTPTNVPATRIAHVNPDGIAAAVLLSVLATAGFFYVSIMPALVSGLITGLGFSPQVAGRVASCNIYGAAAGAFCAAMIVRSVSWRRAAVLLLCILLLLDLCSTLVREPLLLAAVRLVHGVMGGLLVGITYGVMSRTAFPDRCFGVLMIVQSTLGGIGSMYLPRLVPEFGAPILFFAFAALSTAALIVLPFLPAYAVERVGVSRIFDALPEARSWRGLSLALGGQFRGKRLSHRARPRERVCAKFYYHSHRHCPLACDAGSLAGRHHRHALGTPRAYCYRNTRIPARHSGVPLERCAGGICDGVHRNRHCSIFCDSVSAWALRGV